MPLQAPHAEQARLNSSIALIGDGAPARGGSFFKLVTARRMLTPHRAISNCVGLDVAKIDASARRTAGASDLSEGKFRTVAVASGMALTRDGDSARSGRIAVNDCPVWVCACAGDVAPKNPVGAQAPWFQAALTQASPPDRGA